MNEHSSRLHGRNVEWIVLQHLTGIDAPRLDVFCAVRQASVTLGRDPACDVRFDAHREDSVGRRHAQIVRGDGDRPWYRLLDLDAQHGTYVNGARVIGHVILSPGDVIQVGSCGPQLRFEVLPKSGGRVVRPMAWP